MSTSRFEVKRVSENDGKTAPASISPENDMTKLVEPASESGSSTPTETKRLMPNVADKAEVNVQQNHVVEEKVELLPGQKSIQVEPPVVEVASKPVVPPIAVGEQGDDGLVMKDPSPVKETQETNNEEATEELKVDKSRFHVEFVDAKDDAEEDDAQSPPMSPGHDSTNNSMTNNTHSKTYYLRTFGHNTQEAVPMVAYYQNSSSVSGKARPTLDELHNAKDAMESPTHEKPQDQNLQADLEIGTIGSSGPIKFGWIKGVLVRCLLNIWGVMLFLRMSWVVGQAGIGFSLVIVLLSAVVTVITTLSMSAICTNGQVRGGGAYYLISRSLGPEFGGAIGLIFSLANAVAVAMYVVGFAETVVELMVSNGASMTGNPLHDTRIIGAITVLLLLGITQLGMAWEAKTQIVLLVILLIAILNFVVGTFIPATEAKNAMGFFNYQGSIATENFVPSFQDGESFFSVFSIFFPAATGILAGCNISGDLKDAQKAIPKGTLLAILITTIVYCLIAVMLGCVEVRAASGNVTDFVGANLTDMSNCTTAACQLGWDYGIVPGCHEDESVECYPRGLLYDMQAMEKISGFGPIITAGIFAATLSSALASLVSAPKIFQAVCRDKIFPGIAVFGKGAPVSDEPRWGYLLAFVIALAFILIGELNAIAPIISNFFLASYTLINYSCFAASLAKSPGWRPAFRYYNMWVSLFGAFLCCGVMFIITWWSALITVVIVVALYKYVDYKKPEVNWGSSTQAYFYVQALNSTLKLSSVEDHVKNFRPQTLVLTGPPSHRPSLVHFATQFTKNVAFMTCANVVQPQTKHPFRSFLKQRSSNERWLRENKIKSFYNSIVSNSLQAGVTNLMQTVGLGKLRTNILLMGFKRDWKEDSTEHLIEYIDIIHNAFDLNYGICILRLKEGLDVSMYINDAPTPEIEAKLPHPSSISLAGYPSTSDFSEMSSSPQEEDSKPAPGQDQKAQESKPLTEQEKKVSDDGAIGTDQPASPIKHTSSDLVKAATTKNISNKLKTSNYQEVNPEKLKELNQLQRKQEKGKTIDVWWLFDDGGLTILLPYLLSLKQQWAGCHLRVFTGGKQSRINQEKRTMAQLLSKFRIDFKDVIVIGDIGLKPKKSSVKDFEDMIKPVRLFDEEMTEEQREAAKKEMAWKITDDELEVLKEKTNRQIRLRELLQKHSKDAALIVMTLPMARKGTCSAGLYMSWMEELSRDMPPMLLMRGNQTSVLTFYS